MNELQLETPVDLNEKIIVPSPLVRRVEALEFTDPAIPGDIKVDAEGELLKSWFEYESVLGSHVESYDNWVINIIKRQLASRKFTIPQGEVTVTNPIFYPPRITTSGNSYVPLTPQMARENGYTYSSELYVDYVLNQGTPQEEILPQSFFGKIPVMLGSVLCHLRGKTQQERTEMGECIADPFGYFIIKGSEKVILIQEKLRVNRIFLYHPNSKDAIVCKMTSNTITGSTNVTIAQSKKSKAIKIHLAFMGRSKTKANKIGNTISVFQVYRMLGVKDPNQILKMISMFTKKEYVKKIWVQLQPTFVKLSQVGDDIEHISKKKGLGNLDYGIKKSGILRDLKNELFAHIPAENIKQKLYMLSIMIARYAEYLIGERKLDDRDNWGNKRLEGPARSLEQLFGNIWREIVTRVQDTIGKKGLQGLQSVKREIVPSFIVDNFVSSFNSNNWGVQGSYMPKENITDNLKRDTVTAVYSHLTKVNTPTNRRAKQTKVRLVQMSQLGYICVTGDTDISIDSNHTKKISELEDGNMVVTVSPNDLTETPSRIKNYFTVSPDKLLEITTITGRTIKCTPDHPFLVKRNNKNEWINAGELSTDDKVVVKAELTDEYSKYKIFSDSPMSFNEFKLYHITEDKVSIPIMSIKEIDVEPVYDFETIHSNHSFIANGFVTHNCHVETPEGEQCGLVKNLALTAYISIERNENIIIEHAGKYISNVPTEQMTTPLMLNGKFMGWCEGTSLHAHLVNLRRHNILYKDTCLVLDNTNFFYIYTDGSRPTRPLLIVDPENHELVIKNKNLWTADMKTLLEEGCVEYIDAFEQEYIMLAQRFGDIEARNADLQEALKNHQEAIERLAQLEAQFGTDQETPDPRATINDAKETLSQAANALKEIQDLTPYTHSELDPTATLGIAASLVPMANRNQGPRNTYQCQPTWTPVLQPSYVRTKIGDLKDGDTVVTIDPQTLKMSETKIHSHFVVDSKKTSKKMVEITTHSGRVTQSTDDHKFLTFHGWVEAGMLSTAKHHIAVYPSVKYLDDTRPSDDVIMDVDYGKEVLKNFGEKSTLIESHINHLTEIGLLPLRKDNKHLAIIAKMMGYMRSDGHVSLTKPDNNIRTRMTFSRMYDAELFNRDVEMLGFETNKIQENWDKFYNDDGSLKTTHHVFVIDKWGSFAALFILVGCIAGRKTENPSNPIPEWIMNGSDLIKREYIAGFMGGDGCKVNVSSREYKTKRGATYDMARITQHKHKDHLQSSLDWFKQFMELLDHFDIKYTKLNVLPAKDENKRKVQLEMCSSKENLIRYMDTIGYRYATTKNSDTLKVVEWFKYCQRTSDKTTALRNKVYNLHYNEKYTHPQISKMYGITVCQSQEYCKSYRANKKVNLPMKSIRLEEWMNYVSAKNDCIFVPIESIKEVESCMVSDFTTVADTHSFVSADGFITHNCSMGKQALGIYHSQHASRFDTTSKCLAYPTRPLFQTQMDEILGLNELPAGDTVIVAIMTYTGYNQEDAIIMNQAAIDRGLFRQIVYKSYKSVQKRTRTTVEEFARPQVRPGEAEERYTAIDENGVAKLGSFVREGDCLIGKVRKNITTGKVENASSYVGVGQEGIVDRVLVSTNPEGMRVVKVKIRQIRKPIIGDKYASRYAQKATVGLILPQEDMPYTESGIVPDIIINPHSIPSRMTIAKLIEIVTSKEAAFSGERKNATSFRHFELDEFKANLVQYGYSSSGNEDMYSGFTGKPFQAQIFTGPCFYQALRHHVMDKVQMRSKGAIKQLSHQPVGGRARKGGQRFGEMERDAIISHGASAFLQERLCGVSDAYQAVYCSTCGTIAIANQTSNKFVCRSCKDAAEYGTCTIPYAYKLLSDMLAGAGFNLQLGMKVEEKREQQFTNQVKPRELTMGEVGMVQLRTDETLPRLKELGGTQEALPALPGLNDVGLIPDTRTGLPEPTPALPVVGLPVAGLPVATNQNETKQGLNQPAMFDLGEFMK